MREGQGGPNWNAVWWTDDNALRLAVPRGSWRLLGGAEAAAVKTHVTPLP